MTPEQLENLVLTSSDSGKLQQAFAGLSASERRALSKTAQTLIRQIMSGKANKDASPLLKDYLAKREKNNWSGKPYTNAALALFALGPRSALTGSNVFIHYDDKAVVEQIIVDRKPEWLDDWLAQDLDREFSIVTFPMLRRWMREGICGKPAAEGYIRLFVWELMVVYQDKVKPPISRQLLAEPDMLDDVWRLFEIENQAFNTDSWYQRGAGDDYETWPDALFRLMQEGHLDRRRLLDASLNGLSLDIKQNQLSGFHKFHDRLSPDAWELRKRHADYLNLLSHRVGHVVKFALKMLGRLEKLDSLDVETFLANVGVVFFQPGKGNALGALRLIKRVLKKTPGLTETGLRVASEGLRHADSDVQAAVLDLCHDYHAQLSGDFIEELRDAAAFLPSPLQPRLLALTGDDDNAAEDDDASEVDIDALQARVSTLSIAEQSALGLDDPRWFEAGEFALPPAGGDIMRNTILPSVEAIAPIRDHEELIDAVSHALEVVDSPDEVERIVDGISRLCGTQPKDFDERTAPLVHRLRTGALGYREGIAGGFGGVRLVFTDLLLTWLTGELYRSPDHKYFVPTDALHPAIIRLRDLSERVAKARAQALLAAPTHTGGWIDPLVWIERLVNNERENSRFERMDFCLSLLRLMPDHRREALNRVSELSQATARIASFALGGDDAPELADRRDYDLWISAARARDPCADWRDVFRALKLVEVWPDSLAPATVKWRVHVRETHGHKIPHIDLQVAAGEGDSREMDGAKAVTKIKRLLTGTVETDWKRLPSAALNHQGKRHYHWDGDLNTSWVATWLLYQWPLCPDAAYRAGIQRLAGRIDMDGSHWESNFGFLHGLFHKHRPWRESGHLLLCMGLSGKDADARGLAIDALIEGIEDGRADLPLLAGMLARLTRDGWLKLNRLGDNLQQAGQVSPLHAWAIGDLIQRWLPEIDSKQHNLFKMLDVLLDVQTRIKQPVSPKSAEALTALRGAGKAAKLAGQLRSLPAADSGVLDRIRAQAIVARLGAE